MSRNHPATRSGAQLAQLAQQPIPPAVAAAADDQPMQDEGQEGYASSTPTSSLTWIAWFCSLPGHEYFCEVTEDFIEDDFNLTGLSAMVPFWKEAMEMVLDVEPEDTHRIPDVSIVEASAELLYGLVHQRYILTRPGLQSMAEKYENGVFGSCLRVYCTSTRLIPCGRSDMPGVDTVKLFCPNCNDIYTPSSSRFSGVDGAFFGTTFAHLFFHTYREYCPAPFIPSRSNRAPTSPIGNHASPPPSGMNNGGGQQINPNQYGGQKRPETRVYVPKIYGFKVSERARSGPRMAWLRLRPPTYEDLDAVDSRGRWVRENDSGDEGGGDGGGGRGRFDDDDDPDEPIDEDEEEEDDAMPQAPAWSAQNPSAGLGRRPGGAPGPGVGRVRAAFPESAQIVAQLRQRRRRPHRHAPPPRDAESSDSDSEFDEEEEEKIAQVDESAHTASSDSALERPVEDGFTSSVSSSRPSKPTTFGQGTKRKKEQEQLAAVKVANFVGKDVHEMFAAWEGMKLRGSEIEHSVHMVPNSVA